MHLHCPIKGLYIVSAIVFALQLCYKIPDILQKTNKDLKAHISLKICLKPLFFFPNTAPALINELSDGDSPDGERPSVLLQQTPICERH